VKIRAFDQSPPLAIGLRPTSLNSEPNKARSHVISTITSRPGFVALGAAIQRHLEASISKYQEQAQRQSMQNQRGRINGINGGQASGINGGQARIQNHLQKPAQTLPRIKGGQAKIQHHLQRPAQTLPTL